MPTAIASRSVDLPEPFSPTKNVTGRSNSIVSRPPIAGMLNGNSVNDVTMSRRRVARTRKLRASHVAMTTRYYSCARFTTFYRLRSRESAGASARSVMP